MNVARKIGKICRFTQEIATVRKLSKISRKTITRTNAETGVATVLLNNPPLNIFNSELLIECTKLASQLQSDPAIKGVILTSNFNGRVFSAGLNIFDMYQRSFADIVKYWTLVQDWLLAWHGFEKPVVAAINGHSPAGGCIFSLMCDYRIMMDDETKKIGMNESQLGLVPTPFLTSLMRSIIGSRKAELSLLRGEMFSPKEAFRINLIDKVADLDRMPNISEEIVTQLIQIPLSTYQEIKSNVRENLITPLAENRLEDAESFARMATHSVVQEKLTKYITRLKTSDPKEK